MAPEQQVEDPGSITNTEQIILKLKIVIPTINGTVLFLFRVDNRIPIYYICKNVNIRKENLS